MTWSLNGLTLAVFALMPVGIGATRPTQAQTAFQPSSMEAAAATTARFHQLLARGDSAGAARLLAPDAVIQESGDLETRAEYIAHHLGADIQFAKAVPSKRTVVQTRRESDVVWVVATSVAKGSFEGRPVDSRGAELMILTRSGRGWHIRAIHWSSHRNSAAR